MMQFSEYKRLPEDIKSQHQQAGFDDFVGDFIGERLQGKAEEYFDSEIVPRYKRHGFHIEYSSFMNFTSWHLSEEIWKRARRPFYNIWPSMVDAMESVNFSKLTGKDLVLPLDGLLVRLPKNSGTILVSTLPTRQYGFADMVMLTMFAPGVAIGYSLYDDTELDKLSKSTEPHVARMLSIVASLALLGKNPDIIEPIPLNKDIEKYEKTHSVDLIERAIRKGLHGFNVGRHVEAAPGFRKPHFAIRWKGKGRVRPELVPVRGCVVKRNIITEIPTGYLDDIEAEISLAQPVNEKVDG